MSIKPGRQRCVIVVLLSLFCAVYADEMQGKTQPLRRSPEQPRVAATNPVASSPSTVQRLAVPGISLQNNLLSLEVRDQDLHAVLESIALQGQVDIRHLDGVPNKRISIRFSSLPMVDGLLRLLRTAEVPGYALVTESQGGQITVKRLLFLPTEGGLRPAPATTRTLNRSGPTPRPASPPPSPALPPPQPSPALVPPQQSEESRGEEEKGLLETLKTNTLARRLLSQIVHPNEEVRDRALERLVRLIEDDQEQAALLEFLEPLMDALSSDNSEEQDAAREEIRKMLQ